MTNSLSPRQGEIRFFPVAEFGDEEVVEMKSVDGAFIVGESESHHHHILDAEGVTVMERTSNVPTGMRILHAIVKAPTRLRQTAGNAHGDHVVQPGNYIIRIKRERQAFTDQIRRVAD